MMDEYKFKTIEEIRWEDYHAGRNKPVQASTASGFGSSTNTGFMGSQSNTGLFSGSNTGFGMSNNPSSMFGGSTQTSPFGTAPTTSGFGQSTTGFGTTTPSTGLFGSSNTSSTMGNQSSVFGGSSTAFGGSTAFGASNTNPTPSAFGGSGGMFGTSTTTNPPSTGLFGQSTTTPSGGLFGNTNATPSIFGQTATNTNTGTGLFSSNPTPSSTSNVFGSTTTTTPSTGLFGMGASTTANPLGGSNPFGSTTTTSLTQPAPASGGLFGTSTTSSNLFGGSGGLGAGTTAPSTGLFGTGASTTTTTPSTGLFGTTPAPAATTSNLFGGSSTLAPPASTGGLFGTGASTTPATGGLFGTNPAPAASTGGLFSTTATPAANTGGLFGTTPASTGGTGLFGTSTTTPSLGTTGTTGLGGGLFGTGATTAPAATSTLGGGLFGTTPASTSTTGGLFGTSTTTPAPATGGLFGTGSTLSTGLGGGLFGTSTLTSGLGATTTPTLGLLGSATTAAANQPQLSGALPASNDPYGLSALLGPSTQIGSAAVAQASTVLEQLRPPAPTSLTRSTVKSRATNMWRPLPESLPRSATNANILHASPGVALDHPAANPASSMRRQTTRQSNAFSLSPSVTAQVLTPSNNPSSSVFKTTGAITPKQVHSMRNIAPSSQRVVLASDLLNEMERTPFKQNSNNNSFSHQNIPGSSKDMRANPRTPDTVQRTESPTYHTLDNGSNNNSMTNGFANVIVPSLAPKLTKPGYYCRPSMEAMKQMTEYELSRIFDFEVGRYEVGRIIWEGFTDVRGLDLDDIVELVTGSVKVYDDDKGGIQAPPPGTQLNKTAVIELKAVPADLTKLPTNAVELSEFKRKRRERMKQASDAQGAEFISYDTDNWTWTFRVQHFSRYSINEVDSEDEGQEGHIVLQHQVNNHPTIINTSTNMNLPPYSSGSITEEPSFKNLSLGGRTEREQEYHNVVTSHSNVKDDLPKFNVMGSNEMDHDMTQEEMPSLIQKFCRSQKVGSAFVESTLGRNDTTNGSLDRLTQYLQNATKIILKNSQITPLSSLSNSSNNSPATPGEPFPVIAAPLERERLTDMINELYFLAEKNYQSVKIGSYQGINRDLPSRKEYMTILEEYETWKLLKAIWSNGILIDFLCYPNGRESMKSAPSFTAKTARKARALIEHQALEWLKEVNGNRLAIDLSGSLTSDFHDLPSLINTYALKSTTQNKHPNQIHISSSSSFFQSKDHLAGHQSRIERTIKHISDRHEVACLLLSCGLPTLASQIIQNDGYKQSYPDMIRSCLLCLSSSSTLPSTEESGEFSSSYVESIANQQQYHCPKLALCDRSVRNFYTLLGKFQDAGLCIANDWRQALGLIWMINILDPNATESPEDLYTLFSGETTPLREALRRLSHICSDGIKETLWKKEHSDTHFGENPLTTEKMEKVLGGRFIEEKVAAPVPIPSHVIRDTGITRGIISYSRSPNSSERPLDIQLNLLRLVSGEVDIGRLICLDPSNLSGVSLDGKLGSVLGYILSGILSLCDKERRAYEESILSQGDSLSESFNNPIIQSATAGNELILPSPPVVSNGLLSCSMLSIMMAEECEVMGLYGEAMAWMVISVSQESRSYILASDALYSEESNTNRSGWNDFEMDWMEECAQIGKSKLWPVLIRCYANCVFHKEKELAILQSMEGKSDAEKGENTHPFEKCQTQEEKMMDDYMKNIGITEGQIHYGKYMASRKLPTLTLYSLYNMLSSYCLLNKKEDMKKAADHDIEQGVLMLFESSDVCKAVALCVDIIELYITRNDNDMIKNLLVDLVYQDHVMAPHLPQSVYHIQKYVAALYHYVTKVHKRAQFSNAYCLPVIHHLLDLVVHHIAPTVWGSQVTGDGSAVDSVKGGKSVEKHTEGSLEIQMGNLKSQLNIIHQDQVSLRVGLGMKFAMTRLIQVLQK